MTAPPGRQRVLEISVTALLACVVTGVASWLTVGDGWLRERGSVLSTISGNQHAITRLEGAITALTETVQNLRVQTEVLSTEMRVSRDALLEAIRK